MITGSIERWWPAGTLARGARFEAVFPDDGAEEIWTAAEVRAHLVPHQHARVTRSSKNAHDEEDVRAKMSQEQREAYETPLYLSVVALLSVVGALLAAVVLLAVKRAEEKGAFNRMFLDPISGLLNRKRFEAVQARLGVRCSVDRLLWWSAICCCGSMSSGSQVGRQASGQRRWMHLHRTGMRRRIG